MRILSILSRHWLVLLLLNAGIFSATAAALLLTPKVWTAEAEIILPTTTSSLDANLGTLGTLNSGELGFSQQLNPLKMLSSILMSNQVIEQVLAADPERQEFRVNSFRGLFAVSPQSESTVISLSADASSPELARMRLNHLIAAFNARLAELRLDNSAKNAQLFDAQMQQALDNLHQAQQELAQFRQTTNLVSPEDQIKEALAASNRLMTLQTEIRAQAIAKTQQVRLFSARLKLSPAQAVAALQIGENGSFQLLRQQLAQTSADLALAQARYTPAHPTVQRLLGERNQLLQQMQISLAQAAQANPAVTGAGERSASLFQQLVLAEAEAEALKQQAAQLQPGINQLNATLQALPGKQVRLLEFQRRYDIAQGIYNGLVAKAQEAKLDAFSAYPAIQLLDPPAVDALPSGPNKKLILLGAILASLSGSLAAALLLEGRNPRLAWADIDQGDIPVLGPIHLPLPLAEPLALAATPDFQRLAAALSLSDPAHRRILMTASTPQPAISPITFGLAAALAAIGFRVLLVDALSPPPDHLLPPAHDSALAPAHLSPGLHLLSLALPIPQLLPLLALDHLQAHLDSLHNLHHFDFVFFLSPPPTTHPHSSLFSKLASAAILLCQPESTPKLPLANTINLLNSLHISLLYSSKS